jgi:hypothetical protein
MKLTKSKLKQLIKEELNTLPYESREDNTVKFEVGDKVRGRKGWLKDKGIADVVQIDFGWLNQGQVGVQWPDTGVDPLTNKRYIHELRPEDLELIERAEESAGYSLLHPEQSGEEPTDPYAAIQEASYMKLTKSQLKKIIKEELALMGALSKKLAI